MTFFLHRTQPPRDFMKGTLLRLYRLSILVFLAWLLLIHQSKLNQQSPPAPQLEQITAHLPLAASLGKADRMGWSPIYSKRNILLGFARNTRPHSDSFIGYSGPTECLIILNAKRECLAVTLLRSQDTPEYVEKIQENQAFWDSFKTKNSPVLVSGATLTSASIRQGIMSAMGSEMASIKFPQALSLEEIQNLLPQAASLRDSKSQPRWKEVLDSNAQLIAFAATTAPESENVIGYQGPTDSLILLSPEDFKILAVKVRNTFDTDDYVGYVTDDSFYLKSFSKYDIHQLGDLDFKKEKIEGVSGATETSWAVAESLKRKAQTWNKESEKSLWPKWQKHLHWKDLGILLMIFSSGIMMFTSLRGNRIYRRLHQIFLVAFVGLYCGALLSQSLLLGWAKHGLPWEKAPALVLLFTLSILSPVFARRQFYCHHYCPHGTVQQWLQKLSPYQIKLSGKWIKILSTLPAILLLSAIALTFFRPDIPLGYLEPFDAWSLSIISLGLIAFALFTLLISLFIPMAYCRFGCPTGALFKYLRYAGHADHWSWKDGIALLVVLFFAAYEFL